MSELIDREELINRIASMENIARSDKQKALVGRAIYIAEHMPTVDSVVHCKDCTYHERSEIDDKWIYCKIIEGSLKEDSFCSFGEMDEDTEREHD